VSPQIYLDNLQNLIIFLIFLHSGHIIQSHNAFFRQRICQIGGDCGDEKDAEDLLDGPMFKPDAKLWMVRRTLAGQAQRTWPATATARSLDLCQRTGCRRSDHGCATGMGC
jgi:hypothetical protein